MSTVRVSTYCAHNGRCSVTTKGCFMWKVYDSKNFRITRNGNEYSVSPNGMLTLIQPLPTVTIQWSNGYKESGIPGFVAAFDIIEAWQANPLFLRSYFAGEPLHVRITQVQTSHMGNPSHIYYLNDNHLCTVNVERF